MSFVHEDPEFEDLLQIAADDRKLSRGLIEKDYWVTHCLWALHAARFEVWFKGGTSLSKGFGLIERFSEDLDLKIEPGIRVLPRVANWKSMGKKAKDERILFFEKLLDLLHVPGAGVTLDPDLVDESWRSANIRVAYPGHHQGDLGNLAPFVRLEIGSARVTPFVPCDMTSFVHEKLTELGQSGRFEDNRPKAVRCVHPLVTLLEKLDALHRRFPNERSAPATFVRHYEDAAHVILAARRLPSLLEYADIGALAGEMLMKKQLATLPNRMDPAFRPSEGTRWQAIRAAHDGIGHMFWGARIPLEEACEIIRRWVAGVGATIPA